MSAFSLKTKEGLEEQARLIRFSLNNEERTGTYAALLATWGEGDVGRAVISILEQLGVGSCEDFLVSIERVPEASSALCTSNSLLAAIDALCGASNGARCASLLMEMLQKALTDASAASSSSSSTSTSLASIFPEAAVLSGVLSFAADQIASERLSLSEASSKLVVELLLLPFSDSTVLVPLIMSSCEKMARDDTTLRLRYATVIGRVMGSANVHFSACLGCGAVDQVLAMCRSSDVLLQILAFDLLFEFAGTSLGMEFLFSQGLVDWLLTLGSGSAANGYTPDPMLGGNALGALSAILARSVAASTLAASTRDDPLMAKFLRAVLSNIEATDEANRFSALHAVSAFASSSEGALELVTSDEQIMSSWFSLLNTGRTDLKAAVLFSVARLIRSVPVSSPSSSSSLPPSGESKGGEAEPQDEEPERVREIKKRVFEQVGRIKKQDTVAFLVQISRQPITEMRHASMDLFCAVAQQKSGWGLELLYSKPAAAFKEFLEDRSTEHTKEGRVWKFAIMEAIASNPCFDLLAEGIKAKIQTMLREGPFHKPAEMSELMTLER